MYNIVPTPGGVEYAEWRKEVITMMFDEMIGYRGLLGLGPILWIVLCVGVGILLIVGFVFFVRWIFSVPEPISNSSTDLAKRNEILTVLKERLANGEIDKKEFMDLKKTLGL